MLHQFRRPAILCIGALLGQLLLLSGPVIAGPPHVWTFPGDCPTALLQDCIDGAAAGDTIQITTDTPIDEFADIQSSLTLRAAPGLHPTISYGGSVIAPAGTVSVVIRDITFGGTLSAQFTAGSGHSFTARHVQVISPSTFSGSGISLYSTVPASFEVIGSSVDVDGYQDPQIYLQAAGASGDVTFRIIGNRLKGAGASSGGGGIDLQLTGSGSTRADIYNNAIWDGAGCNCGGESGLFIDPQDTVQVDVNVVGNTFDRVHSNAIGVRNDLTAGGHLSLDVFDNAITHSDDSAVYLGDTVADPFGYRAGYNDFYGNGRASELLGHSQGVGNMHKAPGYVDPAHGNFRLKSTSPLINKGLVCTPGGVSNLDAAGRSRLVGPTVDIGAYEFGAGPETGRAFVGGTGMDTLLGTSGADIICGLGGADYIDGEGGNDYVNGGAGPDFVIGGPGSDRIFGGPGNDTVCGRDFVHGNDRVDGGTGTDKYRADPGDMVLHVEHTATCAVA
jgi:Ca2+-binding RTX toxin-like protein